MVIGYEMEGDVLYYGIYTPSLSTISICFLGCPPAA